MGMAAAFLTGAITLVLVIAFNQLIFVILPLAFVLMCGIYFSNCLDDFEAVPLSLGISQLFLAFQAFWAALSIGEIMHIDDYNVCACHYERVRYHSPAAAFLIAFAVKKIFASEKLDRTKTVALSAVTSAAGLAADTFIFIYFA